MSGLHLVHDVLDAQLVDRDREKIGRCDALVLELRDGQPPRVHSILVGGPVRAERIGRWMVLLSRALRALGRVKRPGVSRIPFGAMRALGDTLELDVSREELESEFVERWLADHLIARIPGAGGKRR
ncbi:MAG: hypothetical protein ACHQRK_02870 [Gemmatimonadales bacterium]|jgi:hypothetical protein